MKRLCCILAIVLSFSLVLSSCGSNAAKETPAQTSNNVAQDTPTQASNNITEETSSVGDNNNTADVKLESTTGESDEKNETVPEDEWVYYFNGDGVTIYEYTGDDSNVTIPATLKIEGVEHKVTAIDGRSENKSVFGKASKSIESVIMPDSVISIGSNSFYGMKALKSVTISDSVTAIEYNAFSQCTNLETVTVPDSVISVGSWAFGETAWIKNQPTGPIYIGRSLYGFMGNLPTGDFEIKDGTTEIQNNAFVDSINLTSVTIPDSVTVIGDKAFYNCTGLTSITLPDSVTTIGDEAFAHCSNLTFTIPDSVTSIGQNAYNGAIVERPDGPLYMGTTVTGMILHDTKNVPTELVVKDGTTAITKGFLNAVTTKMSVIIPDSVIYIESCEGTNWWNGQPNGPVYLGKVYCGYKGDMPANTAFEIKEGTLAIADYAFANCQTLTSVTIPESLAAIGDYAFANCQNLSSLTIPDGVTTIGDGAFKGCTNLASVNIPDNVTIIGDSAFFNCTGLTSVNIPDGATVIGDSAFGECTGLTSVTIPYSVTTIGSGAFNNILMMSGMGGDFVITAPVGSRALVYATENGFQFIAE